MSNEANMKKVQEAMEMQQKMALGSDLHHELHIDYTSTEGTHYKGVVVVKRPNARDIMRMGGLKSQYLGDGGVTDLKLVDNGVKFLAHVIATLVVVTVKRPDWIKKVDEVLDTDILYHVYDQYNEWETQFRTAAQAAAADDSDATAGA